MRQLLVLVLMLLAACGSAPEKVIPTPTATTAVTPTPTMVPPATSTPRPRPTALPDPTDIFAANQMLKHTVDLANAFELVGPNGDYYINQHSQVFELISQAGFTAVRIQVVFDLYVETVPPYIIPSSFWTVVDRVVDSVASRGMVAIIDMHQYDALMNDPTGQSERFIAIWKQVAEHYQTHHNSQVFFELLNEPHGKFYNGPWNDLAAQTIAAIRETNPTRPIIVDGPAAWGPSEMIGSLKLPNDPNLIASFHYYSPMEFTSQGMPWIEGSDAWLGTTWTGTPAQINQLDSDFSWAASWASNNNRPIFVGEFGVAKIADEDSRVRWMTAVRQAAEQYGFSWGYWDFCTPGGAGVYDLESNAWISDTRSALFPSP